MMSVKSVSGALRVDAHPAPADMWSVAESVGNNLLKMAQVY